MLRKESKKRRKSSYDGLNEPGQEEDFLKLISDFIKTNYPRTESSSEQQLISSSEPAVIEETKEEEDDPLIQEFTPEEVPLARDDRLDTSDIEEAPMEQSTIVQHRKMKKKQKKMLLIE